MVYDQDMMRRYTSGSEAGTEPPPRNGSGFSIGISLSTIDDGHVNFILILRINTEKRLGAAKTDGFPKLASKNAHKVYPSGIEK